METLPQSDLTETPMSFDEHIRLQLFMTFGSTTDKADEAMQSYEELLLHDKTPAEAVSQLISTYSQRIKPSINPEQLTILKDIVGLADETPTVASRQRRPVSQLTSLLLKYEV